MTVDATKGRALVAKRIEPVYRVDGSGAVPVFQGPAEVTVAATVTTRFAAIRYDLDPHPNLRIRVATDGFADARDLKSSRLSFKLDAGTDLSPPSVAWIPDGDDDDSTTDVRHDGFEVGNLAEVAQFMLHLSSVPDWSLPVSDPSDWSSQQQLEIPLDQWRLTLARVADEHRTLGGFNYVVVCEPRTVPASAEAVSLLRYRIFQLFSFVAASEVGIGPVAGLDDAGRVCWAEWRSPRSRTGSPAFEWCPPHHARQALPDVVVGFEQRIAGDRGLETIVLRAIGHLISASATREVLDIRLPIACAGLEMLAVGLLRKNGASKTALGKPSRELIRKMLDLFQLNAWPDGFEALERFARRPGKPDLTAVEAMYEVRNRVVHPPDEDQDWPSSSEILKAWQLACSYLELAILWSLGYEGLHQSHFAMFPGGDGPPVWRSLTPVPWAPADPVGEP